MSTTLTPQATLCPKCKTELAVPTVSLGQHVICAACRHRFLPPWLVGVGRVSHKAVASFLLAIASLVAIFLTGIPAVVLGVLALSDIRRSKGHLTGNRLAICGVIFGAVLSVLYIPVWIALVIPLVQMFQHRGDIVSAAELIDSERLENGLTMLIRPDGGTKNVALVVLYSIGGDHDPEGQSGLAHLVEHVYVTAAAGDQPAQTADEFMQRYPDGWNAQTGDQFTVIAGVFPKERLDAELEEAAARMAELQITPELLTREKQRLIDEVTNMFDGAPQLVAYNRAREQLRPTAFGGRKGGLPDQVNNVTLDTVRDRVRRFYKPTNAI